MEKIRLFNEEQKKVSTSSEKIRLFDKPIEEVKKSIPESYKQERQFELIKSPEKEVLKDSFWKKLGRTMTPDFLEVKFGLREPNIAETMMSNESARLSYLREKQFEDLYNKEVEVKPEIPKDYKEPTTFTGSLIEGIKLGYKATILPAIGYVAESTGIQVGSPGMIKWGSEFGDKMTIEVMKHPELFRSEEIETFLGGGYKQREYYGRVIGETIPFVVSTIGIATAGGLIGGPTGAGIGAYSSVYAIEKGNAYKSMIDSGIAPDNAAVASDVYGVIASVIENAFGIMPAKIAEKLTFQNAKMVAVNSFKDYLKQELPKIAVKTLKIATEEGGEEVAQSIAQGLVTKWYDQSTPVLTKNLIEDFFGGFIGSLPFGISEINMPKYAKDLPAVEEKEPEVVPFKEPTALELQKMAEKKIAEKIKIPEVAPKLEEKPKVEPMPIPEKKVAPEGKERAKTPIVPVPEVATVEKITPNQDIKDLDAQIRTIEEPTKEFNKWTVEVGLQESLGEQGGDILTLNYENEPTLSEIREDIIAEYKETKVKINEEVVPGITAKSERDEMIEKAIDKVFIKELKPLPKEEPKQKISAEIVKPKKFKFTKKLFKGTRPTKLDESWGSEFFQIKGKIPEDIKKLDLSFETRENKFQELVENTDIQSEVIGTGKFINTDISIIRGDNNSEIYVNTKYLNSILSVYPDAELFVSKENDKPIAFMKNNELVGVLMSLIADKNDLTEVVMLKQPEKGGIIQKYEKPKRISLTKGELSKRRIPTDIPEIQEKPTGIGGASEKLSGLVSRGKHSERVSSIGKRSPERISNAEIEDLVKSKDTFTNEEKDLLKQYTGSGGLERQGAKGRGLLDEYYTPKQVVDLVWDLVIKYVDTSKKNLKILEPSIGIGSFVFDKENIGSFAGFEINPISAKIAKVLLPNTNIFNESFESIFVDERGNKKKFEVNNDLVIGNPPYGEHRGKYKGLGEEPNISKYETYFIKRSLDLTKEGGIVAFVLPSSILRGSQILSGKKEIAKLGELIDARRLPNSTFAYTDIGTDILIFKRKDVGVYPDFQGRMNILSNDMFFTENQDKVLGIEKERKGKWGMEKYVEGNLEGAKDFEEMPPEEIPDKEQVIEPVEEVPLGEGMATVEPKIKKGINEKVILISDKKDTVMSIAPKNISDEEMEIWNSTEPTGELNKTMPIHFVNYYKGKWYSDFNYYHGNIYEKLDQLENDKDSMDSEKYQEQKRRLNEILPERQTVKDIVILPTSGFAKEFTFKDEESLLTKFKEYIDDLPYNAFESSGKWEIRGYINGDSVRGNDKIMNIAVRNRRRKVGDKLMKKFITEELNDEEIKEFEDKYNRFFNSYIRPDYTKIPLTAPINSTFKKKPLAIHPIQMEGAGFLVNKGVGLLAYDVGVGKTLTGILAVNEVLKRGWAKKPLVIVPNSVYQKWIYEIQEVIPNVKINSLANLGGTFKGDLATLEIEDGSLSIITYDGLTKLGFTEETYIKMLSDLKDVMSGFNTTKRGAAKEQEKIAEVIGRAARATRSDRFFEDLGFDHVTIDEVHNFKNIFSGAKMEEKNNEFKNVSGSTSNRGVKLYVMTQYILSQNNGRGVFGLSATPFSNSPLEIYSILSLFAKKRIEEMGIKNVNDFMTMFMKLDTKIQVKANRTVKEEDTIETFHNLQELQKLISEYIDFRSSEDAGVKRPTKTRRKSILFPTSTQLNYLDLAQDLYDDRDSGGALASINEQKSITLSPYLSRYNNEKPNYKEFVDNSPKIKFTMDAIKQVKLDNPEVNQLIYMPQGVEYFPLLKEYLIRELKYKDNEIDFIKGGISADKKFNIQKKFNDTENSLKIIIGSDSMKEGMDLQELTTELYILDLPWNPSGLTQIEGRMWRPGNTWKNVRSHYPLLENSVDQFLFQKLETKEKRINNIWSYTGREVDVGDVNAEELKIDLITDPVMKVDAEEKMAKSVEQNRLETAESELAFMEHQKQKVADIEEEIKSVKEDISGGKEGDYWYDNAIKKLPKLEKKLTKASERLQGVDFTELSKRIELKKSEIEKQEKIIEDLSEKFVIKRKKAETKRVETIVKENDYPLHIQQIANENKATFYHRANEPKTKDEPLGGSEGAAIGTFEEDTPIELGGLDKVRPVEFPELVQLAKDLTGKVPFLRKYKKALARFYGKGGGKIGLTPDLFKRENTQQLSKVLAHEIGHLVDYLPENTLRRGNLIGRLFSLRKFMKGTFGENKIENKEIKEELKKVSYYWRPITKTEKMINISTGKSELVSSPATIDEVSESYRKYRNSASELYADAISMLLNTPGTLERMAPTFYNTFFEQLDNKQQVKNSYFELQDILNGTREVLIELRRKGVKEMFTSGDYNAKELQQIKEETKKKRMSDIQFRLKFELLTKSQAVIDKVSQLEKRGIHINPDDNPVYYLEERNYLGGKIKSVLQTKFQPIYDEVTRADISWSDFGEALFYERILAGDRSELANPRGLTPDAVQELYNDLKTQLGDKWTLLEAQMDLFRERLKEIATEAYNEGLYNPELYARMQENTKYATFQVIDHLEEGMSSKVHHQIGTLKDITNPADASLLKMIETIKAIERNKVNRSIVEKLLKPYFPSEIKNADVVYTGKGNKALPSKNQFEEMIIVMEKGKAKGYYVDEYIQKSVNYNSIGQSSAILGAIRFSNRAWFRPAFITFNLGFQSFNFMRDLLRFWKNTPNLTFFRAVKRYGEATRAAKIRAFGLPKNPTKEDLEAESIIQKLEYDQVFSIKFSDFMLGENAEDTQIQTLMKTYDVVDGKKKKGIPGITPLLNFIKSSGDLIETLPKVAGYYELQDEFGNLTKEKKSFLRRKIGSPDFLEGGALKPWTNEIFLFSNSIMQGIRADVEIAVDPKTRSGFWWKTAKINLLPKIIMFAVLMGLFGDDLKKMMEDASEYDKTNYIIIPVGKSNGKTVYIRVPQDETGRTISGLFWKMLKIARPGQYSMSDITDIVSYTAGQLPSIAPIFEAGSSSYQYLSGKNPYDSFRGRNVLTDDQYRAGGWYSLKPFLQWQWNQLGGGIFMRFNTGNVSTKESAGEKLLNLPIISNIVGRFVKVSDYGRTELYRKTTQEIQKEQSRTRLEQKDVINQYVDKYQKEGGDIDKIVEQARKEQFKGKLVTVAEEKRFMKKVEIALIKGQSDPSINALISAITIDEQVELLKQFKKQMSTSEFDTLLKFAQENKIISLKTIGKI